GEDGANPSRLLGRPRVLAIVQHVMDVDDPALKHCPACRRFAALGDRAPLCDLDELGRGAEDGRNAINLAILPDDEPRFGARQLHGALYQAVQHLLEMESRAANGLENLGSCGLSSKRLGKLSLQIDYRSRHVLMRITRC